MARVQRLSLDIFSGNVNEILSMHDRLLEYAFEGILRPANRPHLERYKAAFAGRLQNAVDSNVAFLNHLKRRIPRRYKAHPLSDEFRKEYEGRINNCEICCFVKNLRDVLSHEGPALIAVRRSMSQRGPWVELVLNSSKLRLAARKKRSGRGWPAPAVAYLDSNGAGIAVTETLSVCRGHIAELAQWLRAREHEINRTQLAEYDALLADRRNSLTKLGPCQRL